MKKIIVSALSALFSILLITAAFAAPGDNAAPQQDVKPGEQNVQQPQGKKDTLSESRAMRAEKRKKVDEMRKKKAKTKTKAKVKAESNKQDQQMAK